MMFLKGHLLKNKNSQDDLPALAYFKIYFTHDVFLKNVPSIFASHAPVSAFIFCI
jgi:hypothetical protein